MGCVTGSELHGAVAIRRNALTTTDTYFIVDLTLIHDIVLLMHTFEPYCNGDRLRPSRSGSLKTDPSHEGTGSRKQA